MLCTFAHIYCINVIHNPYVLTTYNKNKSVKKQKVASKITTRVKVDGSVGS